MRTVVSNSAEETIALGRQFGAGLRPGDVVALTGELGSGKTQFVKGVCKGIGVQATVTSPTFTLINEYPAPHGMVAHVDLYRISDGNELRDLGLESYFHGDCICLIEWAERAKQLMLFPHRSVTLTHGKTESERVVTMAEEGEPAG
jgi:tRNA threonylcarbamoyladenosine biosynthesis protein TsaE